MTEVHQETAREYKLIMDMHKQNQNDRSCIVDDNKT